MSEFLRAAFLSPQFFWFLALIPVIILLYLLKLRRTEAVIPSTMLWIKSLQDLTANAPFQRLRKNLLMFLQILAALLLVFALVRPFVRAEAIAGTQYALIIDCSASMQAREGSETRLDLAKARAHEMVNTLKGGDKMMIIAFSESADVLTELTEDRYRLRAAINAIDATDTRSNLKDVMMIVRGLAPENPELGSGLPASEDSLYQSDLELVLLSDGNLTDADEIGARAGGITFIQVGATANNLGITGINLRRPVDAAADHQTFIRLHNSAREPVTTTVTLYFEDSAIAVEEAEVPAEGDADLVFAHPDLGQGVMRAEIDHEDAFAVDNEAWLAVQPESQVRTLVVSDPESTSGYYLKRALGLEPRVALSAIAPEDYQPSNDYDLTIFDGFAPDTLPQGTLIFMNALPPMEDLATTGTIENPPVLAVERDHPATRFIQLANVRIREALRVTLPEGARTLASTTGGPLIADVSRSGRRILVVSFDVADSNWPLNLSFPLFLQNVVSWTPRSALADTFYMQTGEPIPLVPVPDVATATVTLPGGATRSVELDPLRPSYFAETESAGVYRFARGTESDVFALNLVNTAESDIAPKETIEFGRGAITAAGERVVQTRELWRWLALAALVILMAEWWVYARRAWL